MSSLQKPVSLELLSFKILLSQSSEEKIIEYLNAIYETNAGKRYVTENKINEIIKDSHEKVKKFVKKSPESWNHIMILYDKITNDSFGYFSEIGNLWKAFFSLHKNKSFDRVIIVDDIVKITWKDGWKYCRGYENSGELFSYEKHILNGGIDCNKIHVMMWDDIHFECIKWVKWWEYYDESDV